MKKTVAILLSLLAVFCISACKSKEETNTDISLGQNNTSFISTPSLPTVDTESAAANKGSVPTAGSSSSRPADTSSGNKNSSSQKGDLKNTTSLNTSSKPVSSTEEGGSKESATSSKLNTSSQSGSTEGDNIKTETPTPESVSLEQKYVAPVHEKVGAISDYTPLSDEKGYYYSLLSENERLIYNEILKGIGETKNLINIKKYKINFTTANKILQMVLADHTEYFYVARTQKTVYDSKTGLAIVLCVYYTDGQTIDELDQNGELTFVSSRNNIDAKIRELNLKTTEILNKIPKNAPCEEKVKQIHDYLVLNTKYNKSVLEDITASNPFLPKEWDIYGAICDGQAICEGYSKAFAYLCRLMGINATTLSGKFNGEGHTWNAVNLENAWYLTDLTLNDYDSGDLIFYGYYNITSEEMLIDHTPDSTLPHPDCTATKLSFKNTFGISIENGQIGANYKAVIDKTVSENEKRLCLFYGDTFSEEALYETFFAEDSPFEVYKKEKGYNISLSEYYKIYGKYVYLTIH